MQEEGPTTLVVPTPLQSAPIEDAGVSTIYIVVGIVFFVCVYGLFGYHRRRQIDTRELTFRKLTKQMGFNRRQINAIRRYAVNANLSSPLGVVMNQELVARALAD
tara:strand:+ start:32864 stop:33178 length:315 start_codon:yes stop_codon:yes gene_type:complete